MTFDPKEALVLVDHLQNSGCRSECEMHEDREDAADAITAALDEIERLRDALRNSRVAETMLIADHLRKKAQKASEMPPGFTIESVPPEDVARILDLAADAIDRRARAALRGEPT